MQQVADKYYYWYNLLASIVGTAVLCVCVAAWVVPALSFLRDDGFSYVTGIIGLSQAFYGFVIFRRIAPNRTWAASLFAGMLFALNGLSLLHNTGQLRSGFLALWILQVFLSGIFGLYAVIGWSFLITIYFLLTIVGQTPSVQIDAVSAAALLLSYVVGLGSYWFWRRLYVDPESKQVKQLTGQLKNDQQQAEILIHSITDGMIVITTKGKITLMNTAAAEMTQWSIEEANGLDVQLVVKLLDENGKAPPEDENPLKKVFSKQKPVDAIMQLIGRENRPIIVSIIISPIILPKSETVTGAVAVLRDISASRAEEKRHADFISTASHEMRTPVAAIEGYLALALNEKVSSIDMKARGFLEKAHSSTQHLGQLFQDLLTSAKAEDGRLVNHPVVVEMGSYLEQLSDTLRFAAEKKGVFTDFIVGANNEEGSGKVIKPFYYVHVDPDRIQEVITNLFDNAVKYTENGRISIGLTGNKDVVQFYIKDTGSGIAPEDVPHLFQKFYRVDSSITRTIGGTGLGLFICRKIVELYQGHIWVESILGKGSTFYINLPRLTSQKAAELQAAEASLLPTISGGGP